MDYTDTITNVVVFDRKKLANSNRNEILNDLGHEFGHYSKAILLRTKYYH